MHNDKIAAIPANGIGTEVIVAGLEVPKPHALDVMVAPNLMVVVEAVTAGGLHMPDLGGAATTAQVARAVCDYLQG